jgi:Zn-dependent protease
MPPTITTAQDLSKNEVRDIIISVAVVSAIFAIPNYRLIPFYVVAVIIAFLFHELAHRYLARRFGAIAVFKMWPPGLLMGLVSALIGFKFVAPGAVVIYPYRFGRWGFRRVELTATEMGMISIAGIAVNMVFAAIFLPFSGAWMFGNFDVFGQLSFVNAFLAVFNLIPIPPLDGSKVFKWKPWLWALVMLFAVLLVISFF